MTMAASLDKKNKNIIKVRIHIKETKKLEVLKDDHMSTDLLGGCFFFAGLWVLSVENNARTLENQYFPPSNLRDRKAFMWAKG